MKGRIKINAELCKGCMYCMLSCPKGVIAVSKGFNKSGFQTAVAVAMDKCTGCGICAFMCPDIAIEVWQDKKKVRK